MIALMEIRMNQSASMPVKLNLNDFQLSRYFEVVPPGVVLEDVLASSFWAHVAQKLRLHDQITVVAADGSFDVELRVIRKAPGFLQFRTIRLWTAEALDVPGDKQFTAAWAGPALKWVVKGGDGERLASGLDRAAAMAECRRLQTESGIL